MVEGPRSRTAICIVSLAACLLVGRANVALSQDVVEFLSGARAEGKVGEIRNAEKEFDFVLKIGENSFDRTYPFSKVHAVTIDGKRFIVTPLPDAPDKPPADEPGNTTKAEDDARPQRGEAEVNRMIDEAGHTPPDWFDDTPLEYPSKLDLSWPLKPEGKWNNQVNVGQYMWDVINPNPDRWRSGVRLIHHLISMHRTDSTLLTRDMNTLGMMYFRLFQDYPRAAFWLRKAGATSNQVNGVALAECYWRLGNRQMAVRQLGSRAGHLQAIKLLGDMGDTDAAVRLAKAFGNTNAKDEAALLAGDALRLAGRYSEAIQFYEQVLASTDFRNEEYGKRYQARAHESIEAIRLFDQADVSKVADGSYRSNAMGYNGQLEIEVRVAAGRIEAVEVTQHREKQFYSALTDTPTQILKKQSVRGIDATSRATITSQAIVNATAKALATGAK